jgi:hypothetical protein
MWNFDTKVANLAVKLSSVKQSAIALSPDAKCMKRTYPVGNRILTGTRVKIKYRPDHLHQQKIQELMGMLLNCESHSTQFVQFSR